MVMAGDAEADGSAGAGGKVEGRLLLQHKQAKPRERARGEKPDHRLTAKVRCYATR